ncbi:MAG: YIP1 family protein [Clostridia bacterium]|nr:YIP1 family protein [Clostridia bacterium]
MRNISKFLKVFVLMLVVIMLFSVTASALPQLTSPYDGYEYDGYKVVHEAPITYLSLGSVNSAEMGLETAISGASDLVYDDNGTLYVLDTGNGRVIALDVKTYKVIAIYDDFTDKNGQPISFVGATGLDIGDDGSFYIADNKNTRVLVFNKERKLTLEITRPDAALAGTDVPFDVTKVMIGNDGTIYVICKTINTGILTFTKTGEFKVFYGSNTVQATADVIKQFFYNKFLTREQRAARRSITPTNFANMTLDANNFIYTIKADTFMFGSKDVVQCLNYTGKSNLSGSITFGETDNDSYSHYHKRLYKGNTFVDIDIDSEGMMNILDSSYGRVYQYTVDGDAIGSFGGNSATVGDYHGMFKNPTAIESINGEIVVLDAEKNCIHRFAPTEYGLALRKAFLLGDSTDLDAREAAWNHVLVLNSNSTYPYYGLGLVHDERGEYKEAMDNFQIAGAQDEYSKAFKQYRKQLMAENLIWIILVIVAIIAVIIVLKKVLKAKMKVVDGTAYSPLESKWGLPIYTLFHPVDSFDQFKDRKTESPLIASGIIVLWFIIDTLSFFCTGFSFSTARVTDFNLLIEIFKTAGLFLLFVSANWSMCTLLNGKGTFKEIYCAVAYSLIPYIISIGISTALSNILTGSEGVFLTLITTVGTVWSLALVAFALITLHEYSFGKMLSSVLLTIIAMAVIGFLMALFYTLMLQVWQFGNSLIQEIQIR